MATARFRPPRRSSTTEPADAPADGEEPPVGAPTHSEKSNGRLKSGRFRHSLEDGEDSAMPFAALADKSSQQHL